MNYYPYDGRGVKLENKEQLEPKSALGPMWDTGRFRNTITQLFSTISFIFILYRDDTLVIFSCPTTLLTTTFRTGPVSAN